MEDSKINLDPYKHILYIDKGGASVLRRFGVVDIFSLTLVEDRRLSDGGVYQIHGGQIMHRNLYEFLFSFNESFDLALDNCMILMESRVNDKLIEIFKKY